MIGWRYCELLLNYFNLEFSHNLVTWNKNWNSSTNRDIVSVGGEFNCKMMLMYEYNKNTMHLQRVEFCPLLQISPTSWTDCNIDCWQSVDITHQSVWDLFEVSPSHITISHQRGILWRKFNTVRLSLKLQWEIMGITMSTFFWTGLPPQALCADIKSGNFPGHMTFLTQKMRPSECVIQSETHSDVINLGINLDFYSS